MGKAVAEVIGEAAGEDLGLGFQTAKSTGVDDAVAVALEVVAIGMLGLGDAASAGLLHPHGVVGQHGGSLALGQSAFSSWHLPLSNQHSAQKPDGQLASCRWAGRPPDSRRDGGATLLWAES